MTNTNTSSPVVPKIEAPGILKKTTIKTKKALMYYLGAMNFMFVYSVLAYSIAVFLTERFPEHPNAIFLVGIILGSASLFGLFVDVFLAYLQKLFNPKSLILTAIIGVFLTVGIFLGSHFSSALTWPLFTILAAFAYGWSADLYDITMSSVIFNNTKKEEYTQAISQKKVAEALGMLFGVVVGGALLYMGSIVAQAFLMCFLMLLFAFFKTHFEQEEDEKVMLTFSKHALFDWKKVFSILSHPESIAQHFAQSGSKKELQEKVLQISHALQRELAKLPAGATKKSQTLIESARIRLIDILAKEDEIIREKIPESQFHLKDMNKEVQSSFSAFFGIFKKGTSFALVWVAFVVMFFSFWDTMAITFQPLFLTRFEEQLGFLSSFLMVFFILPVFFFQVPFAKVADRFGRHWTVLGGVLLSSVSLIALGVLDSVFGGSVLVFIIAGIGNAIGYAAAFSSAQAKFASEIRKVLVKKGINPQTSQISAPLRITLNLGNIFGQLCGGFIFAFLGFLNGFLLFGVFLLILTFLSLIFFSSVKDSKEDSQINTDDLDL